jgi:uncharacterized protein
MTMNEPLESSPLPPPPVLPPDGLPSNDEKQWALFTHLSALIGLFVPLGNVLGPLIFWQIKKNEMPFVDDQGKEALNFQITVAIATLVCFLLMFVLIGFLLIFVVAIAWLVFTIIGAIRANNGEFYRYPMTWRIVK